IKGLLSGVSYIDVTLNVRGRLVASNASFALHTPKDHTLGYYVDYTIGNLRIDGEYRRQLRYAQRTAPALQPVLNRDSRFGYLSASYRFSKSLEVGTYHSRYYLIWQLPHGLRRTTSSTRRSLLGSTCEATWILNWRDILS